MPVPRFARHASIAAFLLSPAFHAIGADQPPALELVVAHGDRHVAALRADLADADFENSSLGQLLLSIPEIAPVRIGLAGVASAAGTDPWTAVGTLLGAETTIRLWPTEDDDADFVVVTQLRDAETADAILKQIHVLAGSRRGNARAFEVDGHRVVAFQDDAVFEVRTGDLHIVTNRRQLLSPALTAATKPHDEQPEDAPLARLEVTPEVLAAALADSDLNDGIPNALGGVVLGGWIETLRGADGMTWTLDREDDVLALTGAAHSAQPLDDDHDGFLFARPKGTAFDASTLAGYLGEIELSRDWDELFADREAFLDLSAASEFVDFTNVLTSLMGRLDFVEDILARVAGPVRLVAIETEDADVRPVPDVPDFGLVIPLEPDPERPVDGYLHSVAMSLFSVINLDRPAGAPGLLVENGTHHDHRITFARFEEPEIGARPVEMNFSPALAIVGDQLFITSSRRLAERCIDAVEAAPGAPAARGHDRLFLNGPAVRRALAVNRESMIAERMLEEGSARAEAAAHIDLVLDALTLVESLDVTFEQDEDDVRATGRLRFDAPAPAERKPERHTDRQ